MKAQLRLVASSTATLGVAAACVCLLVGWVSGYKRVPPPRHVLHLPARLPDRTVRVPILLYHRIDYVRPTLPTLTRLLTVDPGVFAQEMRWLVSHGHHAITQTQLFDALMHGKPLPSHPVMITFDDGYRDVLGKAAATLVRLHMPATSYVITDRISGPDSSFLTWGQLRTLERDRIEIGSHTVTHAKLTGLDDAKARAELVNSRRLLEARLGHPVQWLAYPLGGVNARIAALTKAAGYVLAVTTVPGAIQSAGDPLQLPRYEILSSTSLSRFASIVGS